MSLAFNPVKEITQKTLDGITENENFYLIKSIKLKEIQDNLSPSETYSINFTFPNTESDIKSFDALVTQTRLEDKFSEHYYGAKRSENINNRIHLYDITQRYFKGYSPGFFYFSNLYNNVDIEGNTVDTFSAAVYVTVKDKGKTKLTFPYSYNVFNFTSFISYPDPDAVLIEFEAMGKKAMEFPLKPHPTLNLAYYLDPKLQLIKRPVYSQNNPVVLQDNILPTELDNVLIVSELENLFVYPNRDFYEFNSKINFIATNRMSVSDFNFGKYNLFVFTEFQNYVLEQGIEVVYQAIRTTNNTFLSTNRSYANTHWGVVYISGDEVVLTDGNTTKSISEKIKHLFDKQSSIYWEKPYLHLSTKTTDIVYNHKEREIILLNKGNNIVISLPAGNIYTSLEPIDFKVKYGESEILVAENFGLEKHPPYSAFSSMFCEIRSFLKELFTVNYLPSPTPDKMYEVIYSKTPVSFKTLPIYFGADEVKNMLRLIVRGKFFGMQTNPEEAFIKLYGTNDGVNFIYLKGLKLPLQRQDGNFKDIDLGLLARAKFRAYAVEFTAELNNKSIIQQLDFEVSDNYNNDKMR
jgi:hypothetical protein